MANAFEIDIATSPLLVDVSATNVFEIDIVTSPVLIDVG